MCHGTGYQEELEAQADFEEELEEIGKEWNKNKVINDDRLNHLYNIWKDHPDIPECYEDYTEQQADFTDNIRERTKDKGLIDKIIKKIRELYPKCEFCNREATTTANDISGEKYKLCEWCKDKGTERYE